MKWRWLHVTKKEPCPKCGHDSWCSICPDLKIVLCMREVSDRPSTNAMGGWIHKLDGEIKIKARNYTEPEPPKIDAAAIMAGYARDTRQADLIQFAKSLGVSADSLRSLGCQRAAAHRAWAFPMFNGQGHAVGIRLRGDDGSKFAVKGSRQGIFLPDCQPSKTAFIVEGASDSAAILTLGLYGFGRPQCCGSVAIIGMTIDRLKIKEAVIIADSDAPGIRGAEDLSRELEIPNRILIPPTKDLRQLLSFGASADFVMSLLNDLVWRQPRRKNTFN